MSSGTAAADHVVTRDDVIGGLRELGLVGHPVCVHASLRSFGRLEDGPATIIDAVLDSGGTLMVPTASFRHFLAPRPLGAVSAPFNSDDDGSAPRKLPDAVWSTESDRTDPAMGSLPQAVLRRTGRVRGEHPISSFTAIGREARVLVSGQRPLDVFAPLRELMARGGSVIGMGVGLATITLIHEAERRAGIRLIHRWARTTDGVIEIEHGGCSKGFERLAGAVADIERHALVGSSQWRAWPARAMVDIVADTLRRDPSAARCDDPACVRCRDGVASALAHASALADATSRPQHPDRQDPDGDLP